MSWDAKAYDRERWLRVQADPVLREKAREIRNARMAARRAEDPEWHERRKAYLREYHQANKAKHVAKTREWRLKNPGCRSSQHRKDRYRLSADDYKRLVDAQGGKCEICAVVPSGKSPMGVLHVDHCHQSGEVRALLCQKCNTGLGSFKDSSQLLMRAAFYISAYRQRHKHA